MVPLRSTPVSDTDRLLRPTAAKMGNNRKESGPKKTAKRKRHMVVSSEKKRDLCVTTATALASARCSGSAAGVSKLYSKVCVFVFPFALGFPLLSVELIADKGFATH